MKSERKTKDEPQASRRRLDRLVRFPSDLLWFLRRWSPISVKFNTPKWLWRMAMNRAAIHDAVMRGRERIAKEEANGPYGSDSPR